MSEVVILPAGEIVFRHVKDEGVYTFKDGEWVRKIKDMYAQIYPDFAHLKHHI